MILFESVRVALAALWANKLRALLTMLGVIIGVFSVIIMIAVVQGLRQQILDQFAGNGANLIFASYQPKLGAVQRGGFAGLTMEDARAVEARCPMIGAVSPSADTSVVAQVGGSRRSVTLTGVLDTYNQTQNLPLTGGRFISADDVAGWGKACVIGHKVKQDLFGDADPLGKEIRCTTGDGSNVSLIVVGLLEEKDRGGGGQDYQQRPLRPADVRAEALHRRRQDQQLLDALPRGLAGGSGGGPGVERPQDAPPPELQRPRRGHAGGHLEAARRSARRHPTGAWAGWGGWRC